MMVRLVKLEFDEGTADDFLELFEEVKESVRAQPGCHGLMLKRDINHPHIFFTYSHWDSEEDLNRYRNSPFFGKTWKKIKALLSAKPLAWSVDTIDELP